MGGGGYSGVNFGHLKSEVFRRGGGGLSGLKFQKGDFWKIWTKIYCSARNLLVHHILRMWRLTNHHCVNVSRKIEYISGWKKEAWEGYDAAIKRMLELPLDEYKNKHHRPSIKGVLLGLPVITGLSILGVIVWIKYR